MLPSVGESIGVCFVNLLSNRLTSVSSFCTTQTMHHRVLFVSLQTDTDKEIPDSKACCKQFSLSKSSQLSRVVNGTRLSLSKLGIITPETSPEIGQCLLVT